MKTLYAVVALIVGAYFLAMWIAVDEFWLAATATLLPAIIGAMVIKHAHERHY